MHKHTTGFGLISLLVVVGVVCITLLGVNIFGIQTTVSPEVIIEDLASQSISLPTATSSFDQSQRQAPALPLVENEVSVAAKPDSGEREVITLAGGCFWCSEAFMQETSGVVDVISGYAGGSQGDANYKTVSGGKTAHREAVQVTFDPQRVSIDQILDVYWAHIDPTDEGGQFADRGFQYTTAIFYHTSEQKIITEASKDRLSKSGLFSDPIATFIIPYSTFYRAEEYHQDYYKKAADHYERYKKGSGRAGFVEENWAKAAALEFLESEN